GPRTGGVDGADGTAGVTGTAPANAATAAVRIVDDTTATGKAFDEYWDGVMLVEGGVPTHYYGSPPPNLLNGVDPSFETGISGWSALGGTPTDTEDWSLDGSWAAHIDGTVTNNDVSVYSPYVDIHAGLTYSARVSGQFHESMKGTEVGIEFWDGSTKL